MSNSSLTNYTKLSPNCNKPRNAKISKITVHHMAGNLTVERCGELFAAAGRQASSNYGIGSDGRIGLYVNESDRAWTSGSPENDNRAVTVEVANDSGAPEWTVSPEAWNALVRLCTDICKRNGIGRLNYTGDQTGNLTEHRMFQATACPGPYLHGRMGELASAVNAQLAVPTAAKPTASVYTVVAGDTLSGIAKRFGTTYQQLARINGIADPNKIFPGQKISLGGAAVPAGKSVDTLAREVLRGDWGNGAERKNRLTAAGYDYAAVQKRVNELAK